MRTSAGTSSRRRPSLKEREQAIEALVKPIQETLARTSEALREIEVERQRDFGSLRQNLTDMRDSHSALQRETRNLVQALSKPQVRGQWGEIALRRLVELAGMTAHCDFEEQVHVVGSDGALRPDMVVHLPEGRDIVIDVKTPLDAYLTAAEAPSDEARAAALKRHAQHVADRVRTLSSKNYAAQFELAPQFVVLFLPGDQFLSSALDQQPDLLDRAMSSNIILTTPSTLLALLKTVYNGWQTVRLAENAERIRGLAEELYARLATFRNHMGKIGSSLEASVNAFNCGGRFARAQRTARCAQVHRARRAHRQADRGTRADRSCGAADGGSRGTPGASGRTLTGASATGARPRPRRAPMRRSRIRTRAASFSSPARATASVRP